jgi:DMSO/TMAO reductase YedYZ molybdopterin-dependent catalytic subunit
MRTSSIRRPDRRRFLATGLAGLAASLVLPGCDRISQAPRARDLLARAENLTQWLQRGLLPGDSLAREFTEADLSAQFRANGTTYPESASYEKLAANDFADWRLTVYGQVRQRAELSLADLRRLPARTQITRHDCVEGWSCIGQWTGPPLSAVLDLVGLQPDARFIVFQCADSLAAGFLRSRYYESIDLIDAFHPQTILAYEMNGQALPIAHGAPLRLRVERQLGYKMAKYITDIEVVADFARIGEGKGGFWEDQGYEWYAGI